MSIGKTAEIIADIIGVEVEIVTEEERLRPESSEVERLWADNSKAREFLDWIPENAGLNGFRQGGAKTIEWFSRPENLAKYKPDTYSI